MINSLAYIHPGAKIGKSVTIEPFSYIGDNVEIGDGTWIGPNVNIMPGARIGKNCKIFPGAVIAGVPQDLKFKGEDTLAVIGDNTTIRECVTINRGTSASGQTSVGNNCLIMAYCHVAHDCEIGDGCVFSNNSTLAGHVEVGENVVMAGLVAVHQFVRIGSHAFVTGGSLVRKDVPPFVKAAREPLSYVGVNAVGLKRHGFSLERINAIQDVYRILYVTENNVAKAIDIIETTLPVSVEREFILDFVKRSERGIMRGYVRKANEDFA